MYLTTKKRSIEMEVIKKEPCRNSAVKSITSEIKNSLDGCNNRLE